MKYDEAFERVFRLVLHFPFNPQDPLVSPTYVNAVEQLRLPITKGGFGLASAEATAPGGLYSAVVGFVRWHAKRNFGSGSCCLPALGEGGFPYVRASIDECCVSLDWWGLSVASEPAAAGSDLVILDCDGLLEHLDDAPSQHDVYQALTGVLRQRLEVKLAATADGLARLEAVSRQTFPLVDAVSPLTSRFERRGRCTIAHRGGCP